MRNPPRLLDLFCGAGGAGMGYAQAGFTVTGVDIVPQPHYPFTFIQSDALEYLAHHGQDFDVIHASPPCQAYSRLRSLATRNHPALIPATREGLFQSGRPSVIENVEGAPLDDALMLCGTMFGLNVIRHRLFECRPRLFFPPATCAHTRCTILMGRRPNRATDYAQVTGHFSDVVFAREAMGIDWMPRDALAQAIPPAYTHWIGAQLLPSLRAEEVLR